MGGKNPQTNAWYDSILVYDAELADFVESPVKMSEARDGHTAVLVPRETTLMQCGPEEEQTRQQLSFVGRTFAFIRDQLF